MAKPFVNPFVSGQFLELRVDALVSDGRGLGRHDGVVVLVEDALPGQLVRARVAAVRKSLAEAALVARAFAGRAGAAVPPCRTVRWMFVAIAGLWPPARMERAHRARRAGAGGQGGVSAHAAYPALPLRVGIPQQDGVRLWGVRRRRQGARAAGTRFAQHRRGDGMPVAEAVDHAGS